jgi:hypothetical protein
MEVLLIDSCFPWFDFDAHLKRDLLIASRMNFILDSMQVIFPPSCKRLSELLHGLVYGDQNLMIKVIDELNSVCDNHLPSGTFGSVDGICLMLLLVLEPYPLVRTVDPDSKSISNATTLASSLFSIMVKFSANILQPKDVT